MNAGQFIAFLKRLLHNAKRPVFLIVDGHPSPRVRKIFDFARSTNGRPGLFFLPPYSPELNPDERVWNHLKHHGVGKRVVKSRDKFKRMVIWHLRCLQKTPDRVRAFSANPMFGMHSHDVWILMNSLVTPNVLIQHWGIAHPWNMKKPSWEAKWLIKVSVFT